MKNWKIGTRLGLGFGIILVIMTAMLVVGINRLAKVNAASTDMAENRIPKLMQVEQINEQLNISSVPTFFRVARADLIQKAALETVWGS